MFRFSANGRKGGVLVEIALIVIGINIALWFEGWFEDMQDAEREASYLADLRDDLLTDIKSLDIVIADGERKSQRVGEIIEALPRLDELPPRELAVAIFTPSSYQFFVPSDFTYRSMQESGDFRLLRDADIKKKILRLDRRQQDIANLQKNFLDALDSGYIPLMMSGFDITTMRVTDPSLLQDQVFRNFFPYTKQDTDAMLAQYRLARTESETLVGLIERELSE